MAISLYSTIITPIRKISIAFGIRMSSKTNTSQVATELASFSMNCFWSPEAQFGCALGVTKTKVGYTGGTTKNPTYKNLGDHTETVQISYDPNKTTYEELLKIFWHNHDPMSKQRRQYMSAIFYHNENQQKLALETKTEFEKQRQKGPVVTQILPAEKFYDAENYHQKYILQQHSWLISSLNIKPEDIIDSYVCARLNGYVAGYGNMKKFNEELPTLGLTSDQADYVIKASRSGDAGSCGH